MKKILFAIGIVAFLFSGAIAVESVIVSQEDSSVYDDPPKKDVKKKKCCSHGDFTSKKCDSKSVNYSKKECKDTEDTKVTTKTNETKKDNPDKK
ncbi:MAG: hypothetical protein K8R68_00215 [Bacteroidales bacterium]|nr:hypothetical protein [Bacteroidales bacterium]